jgi:hypothetical protein
MSLEEGSIQRLVPNASDKNKPIKTSQPDGLIPPPPLTPSFLQRKFNFRE